MGKRIHKGPGSVAWKKAIRKSASRMARDLMRTPDGQELKRTKARLGYLKNKGEGEKQTLERLTAEAKERRMTRLDDIRGVLEESRRKGNKIRITLNLLITKFKKNYDIKLAEHIGNYLVMLLNENINRIDQLEWLEKNTPKKQAAKIKRERQGMERECIGFIRKINKAKGIIERES